MVPFVRNDHPISTRIFARICALVLVLSCGVIQYSSRAAVGTNSVQLDPKILNGFLQKHCQACHGPKKKKGDLRLDTLNREITNSDVAEHWREVLNVLNLGEMPPEDEPRPANAELEPVLDHLTSSLLEAKQRFSETGGEVMLRRINRREYRNTMEDLFQGKRI